MSVVRKKEWDEQLRLTLPKGETARIDSVRLSGETRLQVIREAITREIERRRKAKSKAD